MVPNLMTVRFYNTEENKEFHINYVLQFFYCEEENTYGLYYQHPKVMGGYKEEKLCADRYMFLGAEVKK